VVRRRNNRSGSVVSDDGVNDDGGGCCDRQNRYNDSEMVDAEIGVVGDSNISGNGGSSSSLYGRRLNSDDTRPSMMAVVTSNRFDSDEAFSVVARAMIHRYQHQNMSEKEAIQGTFEKTDDLRAFIEALDLKITALTAITDDMERADDDALSEIVFKTHSIFDATLKDAWRQRESSSSTLGMQMEQEDSTYTQKEHHNEILPDHDEYRQQHPKTPKNLRMSPMRTASYNYKNHGVISQSESMESACSEGSSPAISRPFKRPRRWFFPKSKKQITPTFSSATPKPTSGNNPFMIKAALPKFHFDFGCKSSKSTSTKNAQMFGPAPPKPVQSSQLHAFSSSYASMGDGIGNATYLPQTSPIRKVSIEMKVNGNGAAIN